MINERDSYPSTEAAEALATIGNPDVSSGGALGLAGLLEVFGVVLSGPTPTQANRDDTVYHGRL